MQNRKQISLSENYKIVVADDALLSVKTAAKKLQDYLCKITGIELEIINDANESIETAFFIGDNSYAEKLGLTVEGLGLQKEGYLIKTMDQSVYILGGVRGALYGVFSLLEDFNGCRWFAKDCFLIPVSDKIYVPVMGQDIKNTPFFNYRDNQFSNYHYCEELAIAHKTYTTRKGLSEINGGNFTYSFVEPTHNVDFAIGHTFRKLCPKKEYWSRDTDGNIIADVPNGQFHGQICLSNPATFEETLKNVQYWLDRNPGADMISVSEQDAYGFCECDECNKALEKYGIRTTPEETRQPLDSKYYQSGLIIEFVNKIAKEIKKSHPGILVQTYAYIYSTDAPKNPKPLGELSDNLVIQLCSFHLCSLHSFDPMDACKWNINFSKTVESWSKICKKLQIYDYNINFNHELKPHPNFPILQRNMQFFAKNNVKGILMLGSFQPNNFGAEFQELRAYLNAKLMWDPYCDFEKHKNEFIEHYYGEAASKIKEYIDYVDFSFSDREDPHSGIVNHGPSEEYFPPAVLDKCEAILKDALILVKDNPDLKKRIEIVYMQIKYCRLWQSRHKENYSALRILFEEDCNTLGISQIKERESLIYTLNNLPDARYW